jgi:hypothetical protein
LLGDCAVEEKREIDVLFVQEGGLVSSTALMERDQRLKKTKEIIMFLLVFSLDRYQRMDTKQNELELSVP